MARAQRQCGTCPFRGASEDFRRDCASLPADAWPCHTEDLHGDAGIGCRGHFEARRRYASEFCCAWVPGFTVPEPLSDTRR